MITGVSVILPCYPFKVYKVLVEEAERLLFEMGLDIETYIVMSLKAVVREGRIPFDYKEQE